MDTRRKKILLWILDLLINVAIIIGLVLVIQKWLIAPFYVYGSSMCDTLNVIDGNCKRDYGERIIINEATYIFNEPQRGDIIVFKTGNTNGKYYIKRIIGMPGETVEIKDGKVYITKPGEKEAKKLEEPFLNAVNKDNTKTRSNNFSVFLVPENSYFVLGDNRVESTDSRSCFLSTIDDSCIKNIENAFVKKENIKGKAWIVFWPIPNWKIVDNDVFEEF